MDNNEILLKALFLSGIGNKLISGYKSNIFYSDKSSDAVIEAFKSDHLVVLTNHMTLTDSSILHNYFGKIFGYLGIIRNSFRPLVWNLPAVENLDILKESNKNFLVRYLFNTCGRLLPIDRVDPDSSNSTFSKLVELTIKNKHVFNIFPEAGRTREIEFSKSNIMPGAAKAIYDIKKETGKFPCVLCVYLRSENQIGHSDQPAKGKIHIVSRILNVKINDNESPLRQRKRISDQIGLKFEELQEIWKSQV
jgi:hypothetical protein